MSATKKVGILLVLYKSGIYLDVLVNSIKNQTHENLSLYAISCNTSKDEEEYLASIYPAVKILQNVGNIGFAKANYRIKKNDP